MITIISSKYIILVFHIIKKLLYEQGLFLLFYSTLQSQCLTLVPKPQYVLNKYMLNEWVNEKYKLFYGVILKSTCNEEVQGVSMSRSSVIWQKGHVACPPFSCQNHLLQHVCVCSSDAAEVTTHACSSEHRDKPDCEAQGDVVLCVKLSRGDSNKHIGGAFALLHSHSFSHSQMWKNWTQESEIYGGLAYNIPLVVLEYSRYMCRHLFFF